MNNTTWRSMKTATFNVILKYTALIGFILLLVLVHMPHGGVWCLHVRLIVVWIVVQAGVVYVVILSIHSAKMTTMTPNYATNANIIKERMEVYMSNSNLALRLAIIPVQSCGATCPFIRKVESYITLDHTVLNRIHCGRTGSYLSCFSGEFPKDCPLTPLNI